MADLKQSGYVGQVTPSVASRAPDRRAKRQPAADKREQQRKRKQPPSEQHQVDEYA